MQFGTSTPFGIKTIDDCEAFVTAQLQTSQISLTVNGHLRTLMVEHRVTLLDILREFLDLTGAKRACDRGECGACTVLVDEQPMYACHLLGRWWAAIISTSQKQVSAATLESAKHDP